MTVLALILAIIALVLFVLAAYDRDGARSTGGRVVALLPLGLAFLTASLIAQFCGLGGDRVGG